MSTRSLIGKQNPNGTVTAIYCHSDGYTEAPHGVGYKLAQHYTDPAKIDALLALGDLSRLGAEIGDKQDFDDRSTRNPDWCLAYGRDRGEDDIDAHTEKNTGAFFASFDDWGAEYMYLFADGRWIVKHYKGRDVEMPPSPEPPSLAAALFKGVFQARLF